jgi:glycosyltransferase involved in cell wall biosynthesis
MTNLPRSVVPPHPGERVRVALFTDSLEPSGVGRVMELLAAHLPRDRYDLFLICADHPGAEGLAERMSPYVRGTARYTVRDDNQLGAFDALVTRLRDWRIHVFHNHIGATWEGDWGTLAARCAGVPLVVATEHLPNVLRIDHELRHRRRMNHLLHRLFAVSESVRQTLLEALLVSPEVAVTVENGVEPVDVAVGREAARARFGVTPDERLVLFVGRLTEQKDPITLLRAFDRLRRGGLTAARLIVAGDGWLREPAEAEADRLGICRHVDFLGNCREVPALMAAADVLAMPSAFEGLPLAALEAMSCGLPVVGCDAHGVRDAVRHEITGYLAAVGDADAVGQGLCLALTTEAGKRWGQAAREVFARHFTARHMAERQDRAYREALASRRIHPAAGRPGPDPGWPDLFPRPKSSYAVAAAPQREAT